MREVEFPPELDAHLKKYESLGGVLEFTAFEAEKVASAEVLHRAAAIEFMASCDRCLEKYAIEHQCEEVTIEQFFRLRWNPDKLTGDRISFAEFTGANDVEPEQIAADAWSIPVADGLKTAFFHPPHGLNGSGEERSALFSAIVSGLFGDDLDGAEIFSWSTDWSNYFDDGNEWWGAFLWTARPRDSERIVVIAASATD